VTLGRHATSLLLLDGVPPRVVLPRLVLPSLLILSLLILSVVLSWAQPASAQVDVSLELSSPTVEVDQSVELQARAMSTSEAPELVDVKLPPGMTRAGPSIGSNHQISFTNGSLVKRTGINATWQVTPSKTGEFTLGPVRFRTEDGIVSTETVTLKVVPAGTLPRRARRRPRSLFDDDFFGNFGNFGRRGSPLDDIFGPNAPSINDAPPEYRIGVAPDSTAFLRAVIEPKTVTLGQQLTLSIYAYGSRGRYREQASREPRRTDFFSHSIVDTSNRQTLYTVDIGDQRYYTALVRRFALFPLKTGDLEIGPMEMTFYGSGYISRQNPEGLERKSQTLTVHVEEPPITGRPEGYQPGDVGRYKLSADVSPRQVQQGDSISVVATLKGVGNLPANLLTPEQKGVEWLPPTVQEKLQVTSDSMLGGTKTFTYVVRLDKPGEIDLGRLQLPFYNPQVRRYQTAKVVLGKVQVAPKPQTQNQKDAQQPDKQELAELLKPSADLGPGAEISTPLPSRPWFWWLTLCAPLAVVVAQASSAGVRGVLARVRARRDSSTKRAGDAMTKARNAARQGDVAATATALEKVVFTSIEAKTGVRGRALLREELAGRLQQEGVDEAHATELVELLAELEAARFSKAEIDPRELVSRATRCLKKLPARKATS